jgi:hypothetical protein
VTIPVAENPSTVSILQYTQSTAKSQAIKRCPKCEVPKLLSQFSRYYRSKDGHQDYCKDCMRIIGRDWRRANRQKARATSNRGRKIHRQKHPDRAYAQGILTRAIQSGRIVPQPCRWPNCGSTERLEGHHPSYNRPFEIVWLCHDHHKAADACKDKIGFDLQIDIIPAPGKLLQ